MRNYKHHNEDYDECPRNLVVGDQWAETECTCRNPNEVGNLDGRDLLDAMTEALETGNYKGWTFSEMVHGPSVLPVSVNDEAGKIVKHEAIVMTQMDKGQIIEMTLMVTTPEGTTFQDFVPKEAPAPRGKAE